MLKSVVVFALFFIFLFGLSAHGRVECSSEVSVINGLVQERLKVSGVVGLWQVKEHGLTVTIPSANRLVATVEQVKDGEREVHKNLSASVCRTERGIKVTLNRFIISVSFEIYLENGTLKFQELSGKRRSGVIHKS